MPLKPRRCPICKTETSSTRVDAATGDAAPLSVALHGLPVLECAQGHRLFAVADFPLLLLDRLLEQDVPKLPASAAKGLLFKRYHCSECGAGLDTGADQKHTFHVDVELPALPAFGVDLTLPVHRCGRCGRNQLHSLKELRSHTPAALAHAFKSAQIAVN